MKPKSHLTSFLAAGLAVCLSLGITQKAQAQLQTPDPYPYKGYTHHIAGNPYLPLWEHIPDGEPRVFEDPDNPGKFRAYIIGSHDVRFGSYCGPDIHAWSAPVEDLTAWRDEGPLFVYPIENQWDVMYAPDLVEVNHKDGTREYYLYPHSRGRFREPMICKGSRPDGPFTPINMTADGIRTVEGSIIGFDPSIFVENITDPNDPDYAIGFRAYGFWGYQKSLAAQLDQKTMYSARPGTEILEFFLPSSARYGVIRDPEGTTYPALYKGQDPKDFNFYEASSIRQVGNKYVMVFSGYSGPDYGLSSTNSALRYAYGDTPLGPWRSGGVLVDSRGVVPNKDGSSLETTNAAHNTHGSLERINGQWYVFYHRPPRGFANARQAMVAPVTIQCDEKSVADGGKVVIYGYDPYAKDNIWTAKDSQGHVYAGAEVTSEGFHVYGLDPYQYCTAGYACYMTNGNSMQDTWDLWDNAMDMANVMNGDIIGFKYFGFGGLRKASKGIKPFAGTNPKNQTSFSAFLEPKTDKAFTISVMMDGPWDNEVWKGKKIGEIQVPAGAPKGVGKYTVDVAAFVDHLDGKHAIYLIANGADKEPLFTLKGIGFNKVNQPVVRPVAPTVSIKVGGKNINMPATPVRSTNENGIVDLCTYRTDYLLANGQESVVTATASDSAVKLEIEQAPASTGMAVVKATYNGFTKKYQVVLTK